MDNRREIREFLARRLGALSTRSDDFGFGWAAHKVLFHRTGRKLIHHRVVGDLDLTYERSQSAPAVSL